MRAGRWGSWIGRLGLPFLLGLLAGLPACRPNRAPDAAPSNVPPTEIVYELRGGFAGFDRLLTARRTVGAGEGAKLPVDEATVVDKGNQVFEGSLGADGWADLDRLLEAANLPKLRSRYGHEGAVSDAMEEVITVRQAGQEAVAVAFVSDPGDEPPAELKALADRLRELALTLPTRPTR